MRFSVAFLDRVCHTGFTMYRKTYSKVAPKVAPPVMAPVRIQRNWSAYQDAIFAEVSSGSGNVQVDALAGTGKTSTIVEAFWRIPQGRTALLVAFNKSIQTELASRIPSTAHCSTLHSLGLRCVKASFPRIVVDNNKVDGILRGMFGADNNWEFRSSLMKLVSLAKGYLAETLESLDEVMDRHEVDSGDMPRAEFIQNTIKVLESCKKDTSRIDFDDMIWFPHVYAMTAPKYDYVFVDESQDLNQAQIALALKCVGSTGRVISVGDEHQAIYGFRGADSNAIGNIVAACNSKRLPLSVTYRCPRTVVAEAQAFVPELESAPSAKDGTVSSVALEKLIEAAKPGDFVLSRTNAPLVSNCLAFIAAGIPANIQGRDLGKALSALIKKSNAANVSDFLVWLEEYRTQECLRLSALNRSLDAVNDKCDCLIALSEGAITIADLHRNIDKVFTDGDSSTRVMFSSVHKAKGLERNRVFLLRATFRPGKTQEETNLLYVAITRAISELYYVTGK